MGGSPKAVFFHVETFNFLSLPMEVFLFNASCHAEEASFLSARANPLASRILLDLHDEVLAVRMTEVAESCLGQSHGCIPLLPRSDM